MKRVALIPVLLGSTRIPDKNLLLVDGAPMLHYVVEACKRSGAFDEIWVNSEHALFGDIARSLGVKFYQRRPERGGSACQMHSKSRQCDGVRCQTHDHFLVDFMEQLGEPCHLALVHTTSPLQTGDTIARFMRTLDAEAYDSLFSVEERFTETLYDGKPLNFTAGRKDPTQTLRPVQLITWALSGWKTASFIESYRRNDPADPGPTFCGKTGVFPMNRVEALDADTWDDLSMIEACLQFRRQQDAPGRFKLTDQVLGIERCLEDLIKRDGVGKFELAGANSRHSNLQDIIARMGPPPWIYVLIYSATDQIGVICQRPSEGCRNHCHVTHAEWWVVLQGEFEWQLGDGAKIVARTGDVVALPRGMPHTIRCIGDGPGIRLACGARDMEHVYLAPNTVSVENTRGMSASPAAKVVNGAATRESAASSANAATASAAAAGPAAR